MIILARNSRHLTNPTGIHIKALDFMIVSIQKTLILSIQLNSQFSYEHQRVEGIRKCRY